MAWVAEGGTERRDGSQARIPTSRPVTIVTERRGGVVMGDTVDLGPGGMFVALDDPLPVGERFIFRIDLGDSYKPVLSGGEVCWIGDDEHQGMGVRFLDIAEVADALGGGEIPAGPEVVRVRMEHVGPAIEASVVERSTGSLVVDLSLPFLRQGAPLEVGPDVSARSGRVQRAEWIGGDDGSAGLRLVVDLDRSAASAAAEQVASGPTSDVVMAPATPVIRNPSPKAALPDEGHAPEPEPAEAEETFEAAAEPEGTEQEPDDQPIAELHGAEADDEVITSEFDAPTDEAIASPREAAADESDHTEIEEPSPAAAVEIEAEASLESDEQVEEEEDDDDVVDPATFSPFHGVRQKLEALGVLARLTALVALVRGGAAKVAAHPRVVAFRTGLRARIGSKGHALTSRIVPGLKSLLGKVTSSRILKRARKQTRGEPSKVVQSLTARARKATRGRGKTIATVLLVALGAAGAATTTYGLAESHAAGQRRSDLGAEAERANWSASVWTDPDDTDSSRS